MSEFFYDLFMLFCTSDVFFWLLEYLVPWAAVYCGMTLIGGVLHGKPV